MLLLIEQSLFNQRIQRQLHIQNKEEMMKSNNEYLRKICENTKPEEEEVQDENQ